MVEGKLLPTSEEIEAKAKITEKGKVVGYIYPRTHYGIGTVDKNESFEYAVGLDGSFFVIYKGRTVRFDAQKMMEEAVDIINKVI